MNQSIYRKQALERLSSPDQLDQLMPITRPQSWIALFGIIVLLVAAVFWAFLGSVETTIEGYGTLERMEGLRSIHAPLGGKWVNLNVKIDDSVTEGQTLGFIESAESPVGKPIPLICPISGRVLDIPIESEQPVDEAATVILIEAQNQPLSCILYIAVPDGYQVEKGMRVKVLPATFSKHEAAFVSGHVSEAGRYPMRPQAGWYGGSGANQLMLRVAVEFDPEYFASEIYSGTPCLGQITVLEQRPIEILFSGLIR